ncbi:hypothetical protein F480_05345 [Bibersteinia trehalosi Y31]|uniref:Uncharacterized protein n=1 Tax=Bibersteinia trehalosi Y31 TaxID=1261658 RepID=A0A179CZ48_BIBTR|nr:hypothetical protein [Bibersteinia trehalosi]OAQ14890.1 hypothetical protein F480_05345 [Bibersteinia trehalosi Y31]
MDKAKIQKQLEECYKDRELILNIIKETNSTRHQKVLLPEVENKISILEKKLSSLI